MVRKSPAKLEVPRTYLGPYSVFMLGWLDLKILEAYASGNPFLAHFPRTLDYAINLSHLTFA